MNTIDTFHPLTLNVGLAVHNADWNWRQVSSPFTRLYYVTHGSAAIVMPQGTVQLRAGYMYMVPAFTEHSYECDGRFEHYYVHVYEATDGGVPLMESWNFPVEVKAEPGDLGLIRRLADINPEMRLPESDPLSYDNKATLAGSIQKNKQRAMAVKIESRGILYQLFSRFFCAASTKPACADRRIVKALDFIARHLAEPLSVEMVAGEVCLCKDHFTRLFKQETGQTPTNYIIRKKMEKARLMLATQDMPAKGIAYGLGYDDYSYFIRAFKKTVGCTPQEYKIKLNEES